MAHPSQELQSHRYKAGSLVCFLGRSSELAYAELEVFFPSVSRLTEDIALVQEDALNVWHSKQDASTALTVLGGTVKIATVLGVVPKIDSEYLFRVVFEHLLGRRTFGFSTYGVVPSFSKTQYETVKDRLEQNGHHVRFILPREGSVLSAVAVAKQNILEINIVPVSDGYLLVETAAVQEFEQWADRDYNRPFADSKKGMLPPKAARMIVNIALGSDAKGKTVLDPFCGMGTIPCEAILRGAIAMGSDISLSVVEKAKQNTIWLRKAHSSLPPVTYFVSDATHVSGLVREGTIDAIVTEPYMGSSTVGEGKITDPKAMRNILKGLEKLYIGCLKDWKSVLKPHGVVIMAIPEIVLANTKYSVKNVIDSCETLGYTCSQGPLSYSRPNAIVRRMFYTFIKV